MNVEKGMTAEEKLYMDLMSIIHYATEKAQALKHINQFKAEVLKDFAQWSQDEYGSYSDVEFILGEYLKSNQNNK